MKFAMLILLFVPVLAIAAETTSAKKTGSAASASLPKCVDAKADLDEIAATQKANSKTDFKYDGYRKFLQSDSDAELVARLAYSETKATNCAEQERKVLPLITQIIANRVDVRKGDVKSVIYQRNQFASSLNLYPEAHSADFLCPKDADMWAAALQYAKSELDPKTPAKDFPPRAINYYLYEHAEWAKPGPKWDLAEVKPKANSPGLERCIRFFIDPRFK